MRKDDSLPNFTAAGQGLPCFLCHLYYINMMSDIMSQEKSNDSLPNFTAADCKYGRFFKF